MPSVKPIPSLYNTSLKCYGRHCLTSLRRLLDLQKNDNMLQKRESLLDKAKAYVLEYTPLPVRIEMVKLLIDEMLNFKSTTLQCIKNPLIPIKGKMYIYLWQVLMDFLVIHGDEGIKELEFDVEIARSAPVTQYCMQVILSHTLFQNLSWSKNLVSLIIKDLWNVEIVKAVSCHCYNLQHLDLTLISDAAREDVRPYSQENTHILSCFAYLYGGVENVNSGCPKLKTIIFPVCEGAEHSEAVDHAVKMIQFMPDLQVIKSVDTRLIAIKYMDAVGQLSNMKLTNFEEWDNSCIGRNYNAVNRAVWKAFPKVKRYACDSDPVFASPYRYRELCKLQTSFPRLEVIEFYKNKLNILEDIDFMDPMPSVKIFKVFRDHDGIDVGKIQMLNAKFPNLEELVLYAEHYSEDGIDSLQLDILFPKLNSLELHRAYASTDGFVEAFLRKCPSLKKLDLFWSDGDFSDGGTPIDDEFVHRLSPHMGNLERLNLGDFSFFDELPRIGGVRLQLTYESVCCILSACPNLTFLGNIGVWCVTDDEVHKIKNLIKENNWNLEIDFMCFYDYSEYDDEEGREDQGTCYDAHKFCQICLKK
ncbi:uncharacterized protein [Palaemon carinicauda]|uniref:uncharacterized protein n=1 Tax=Palaemon carinicauda TaxID=392227 RepID=UPI0035B5D641